MLLFGGIILQIIIMSYIIMHPWHGVVDNLLISVHAINY